MLRYENLNFFYHLNSFDVLNKFSYNNYYLIPKIDKISLKIFLKGAITPNFLNLYLKNFLLLYLYCFDILCINLNFLKQNNKKKRIKLQKAKLVIHYSIMKKKILFSIFNFFFLFKKFARPFFFSRYPFIFSSGSGKLFYNTIKIITFLPSLMLIDHKEHRIFPTFKKSKIFLTLTIKTFLTSIFYNFFINKKKLTKNYLKNFLLIWYFI